MEITSNKTIVKNTILLYFRMALVTVVGIYTSRVILQMLGVEDFGVYNVAGSAVALFSFLTGALAQSSSRYITVEIGKVVNDDIGSLVRCFKTTRAIHGILAIIIFVLCESLGLLILYKSSIPEDKLTAAFWCFQISTLTAVVNVTQIPFNSIIIAHERMSVYAWVSIFEVFAKLLVCYLLMVSPFDKLIYYAILLFIVQMSVFITYRVYCKRNFRECSLGYTIDKEFFRPIMSFSFWNLLGSLSYSALTQGTTILISFFFGPAVVASRAIANQVKNYVTSFVTNFRTAINPQIIKRNAAGNSESSRLLLFFSTNITFYLMLVIALPLMLEAKLILNLWLVEVPKYTVEFMQIGMLEMLFFVYDVSFYQIFQAEGRLKENAIYCPIMDFVGLGIVYIYYLLGGRVLAIAWCMVLLTVAQGLWLKPFLAVRLFGYSWKDFFLVYLNDIKVFLVSLIIPGTLWYTLKDTTINGCVIIVVSIISVIASSYFIGFTKPEREKIKYLILSKINKKYQ